MADAGKWHCLDEETLPPLERLLPDEVYQALLEEVNRQREAMPPASGLGINHLNTIPANHDDALKKATILMDRTLRWRRSQQNRSASMIRPASALQNVGLHPILTFSPAFRMLSTMKTMSQVGLNERVPVPPEKRFLIHRNCQCPWRSTPDPSGIHS